MRKPENPLLNNEPPRGTTILQRMKFEVSRFGHARIKCPTPTHFFSRTPHNKQFDWSCCEVNAVVGRTNITTLWIGRSLPRYFCICVFISMYTARKSWNWSLLVP